MSDRGTNGESGSIDPDEAAWSAERAAMVETLRRHGIRDEKILVAMGRIWRHRFIPESWRRHDTAYGDHPWTIGFGQTISQPFIVAYMTERLRVRALSRVLEIGAGSGYQTALLAELGARVWAVECVTELAAHARTVLAEEGYIGRICLRTGDGFEGWPEESPFDAILVACAPESVPPALIDQLDEGGRMVLPVGSRDGFQRLVVVSKQHGRVVQEDDLAVRFVPMVHRTG